MMPPASAVAETGQKLVLTWAESKPPILEVSRGSLKHSRNGAHHGRKQPGGSLQALP